MIDIFELNQRLDTYVETLEDASRSLPERLIAAARILAGIDPSQVERKYRSLVEATQQAVTAAHAEARLSDEPSIQAAGPASLQELCLTCAAHVGGLQAELMILHDPSVLMGLDPEGEEDLDALTAVTHQVGLWLLEGTGKKSAASRLRDSGATKAECRDLVAVVDAILVQHFGKGYADKPPQERETMAEQWDAEYGEEDLFEDTELRQITDDEAASLAKQMKGWAD